MSDFDTINELAPTLRLPYCPYEPTAKQEFFLLRDELEAFFGGAAGPGKAIRLDTPLATPSGWTTMGEISEGDFVFDASGAPTLVLATSTVMTGRPCFRVEFSDGAEIVADADHLWLTLTNQEREQARRRDPAFRARRRASRPSRARGTRPHVAVMNREREYTVLGPPEPGVRSTREIAASVTVRGRSNHSVAFHPGLELPERELPLHPYVLGVWLGDGTTRDGSVACGPEDVATLAELESLGWGVRAVPSNRFSFRVVGLSKRLREVGVLGNKHVPAPYLRASADQRLALLQGLMDTDGGIDDEGWCEFTSTKRVLADAVAELVRSLGSRATVNEGRATLYGKDCGPKYRVGFTLHLPAFRLARKLARQRLERRADCRYIVAVEPVESVPVRCIRVAAESGTYLAGEEMIPTHNSWALLMAALQHVDHPGYHALLLRPSLTEFEQQGGLIEVSHDWLGGTDAGWNGTKRRWTFPSGATVSFGYLANLADLAHYKGGGVSFVGFDELTSFPTERLYLSMFRVLRQGMDVLPDVPLRMRSASNPGDVGHHWVKNRFVNPETREPGARYIPAKMRDNPFLDVDAYLKSLEKMHPADRQRLIDGDWDVAEEGSKFRRDAFIQVEAHEVLPAVRQVRYWDLAATEPNPSNTDPDFTVGLLYEVDRAGTFTIRHIVRGRWADHVVEDVVRSTAEEDGRGTHVYVEQDPGSAGKALVNHYKRKVLQGFPCHAGSTRINGQNAAKEVRARPAAAAVGNGLVQIVRVENLREFLDEVSMFPNAAHDDCVDAFSGAHTALTTRVAGRARASVPKGRIPGVGQRSNVTGARRR